MKDSLATKCVQYFEYESLPRLCLQLGDHIIMPAVNTSRRSNRIRLRSNDDDYDNAIQTFRLKIDA